ncbi:MAG: methyltransferase domain-containing protein [Solirubrobacterales bacterium]|nr:methyltransferase domain-containing protein [Solirubrobacterales bacterium]
MRGWVRALLRRQPPSVGRVRFGNLRRLAPVSRCFGFDRGLPIDRYYIEAFLRRHGNAAGYGAGDIRGRVLEVGGDEYARRFGGWSPEDAEAAHSAVSALDVLHVDTSNATATIIGDLVTGANLPSESFDCVICTQTLHVVYDVDAAVHTLHRILKPGGVALVTVAGISQVCRPDRDLWGDYWRFTTLSARRLFEGAFPAAGLRVEAAGNVLAAVSFLQGLAAGELRPHELDSRDPDYEMLITIRAVKGP